MHSATRFSLIPGDTALTVAARGPMRAADADRLAALCLSLPAEVRALRVDLTGTGLVAADVLRRVSRAASSWRYTRAAALTLRFTASRESEQEPAADWVSVEVQFPPRRAASRPRLTRVPRAMGGRSAFAAAPARLALRTSA